MSRIFEASCDQFGIVSVNGTKVPVAVVLSEGKQASDGILVLDGDYAVYIASSATDIESTLEKLSSIVDDVSNALAKIATVLTEIGAGMTGPTTAPPPTLATDVIAINAQVTSLNALKTQVDTLKDALI